MKKFEDEDQRKGYASDGREDNRQGGFHDQGDAKWIVIKVQLWGHNDTLFGRPTPGRPIGGWLPSGCIWWFKLLLISNILFRPL
jgi:hypothetical protein